MGLDSSILKEVLYSKKCSVGKYLSLMKYCDDDGNETEFYITPAASASKNDFLIITFIIKGNWYKTVSNLSRIINYIKGVYSLKTENYTLILHAFFDVVEMEKFFLIDTDDNNFLHKLNIIDFEKLLE